MSRKLGNNAMESVGRMRASYAAASASRTTRERRDIPLNGSHSDYHFRTEVDYYRLMEMARAMDRDDAFVGPAIRRVVSNEIQGGFVPDAQTGVDRLDRYLNERWAEWSADPSLCDVAGEKSFAEFERLVRRHEIVDGDAIITLADTGRMQFFEGHRVKTPTNSRKNIVLGVEINENRERLAYWISKESVDPVQPIRLVSDMVAVPTRDEQGNRVVCHVYDPDRASQTRGVTAFHGVFPLVSLAGDINHAAAVKQQVAACFAILREKSVGGIGPGPITVAEGERYGATGTDPVTGRKTDEIYPGMEVVGQPGEKVSLASPNVPGEQFLPHMRFLLQTFGNSIGLPLILLLMDATETNFSGWRGAFDQAKLGFMRTQERLIRQFHWHVWRWKVRFWLQDGPIAGRRADAMSVKWNTPRWPYIQPEMEVRANADRVLSLQTSPRRLAAELGIDIDDICIETVADNGFAIEAAIREASRLSGVAESVGLETKVDWRDVLFLIETDPNKANAKAGRPAGGTNAVA